MFRTEDALDSKKFNLKLETLISMWKKSSEDDKQTLLSEFMESASPFFVEGELTVGLAPGASTHTPERPADAPQPIVAEKDQRQKDKEKILELLEDFKAQPFVLGKPRVVTIPMIAQSRLLPLWGQVGLKGNPEFMRVGSESAPMWQITLR